MRRCYLTDRDADGRVVLEGDDQQALPTSEEMFYRHWRYTGLRDDQIARLWKDHLEAETNAGTE